MLDRNPAYASTLLYVRTLLRNSRAPFGATLALESIDNCSTRLLALPVPSIALIVRGTLTKPILVIRLQRLVLNRLTSAAPFIRWVFAISKFRPAPWPP